MNLFPKVSYISDIKNNFYCHCVKYYSLTSFRLPDCSPYQPVPRWKLQSVSNLLWLFYSKQKGNVQTRVVQWNVIVVKNHLFVIRTNVANHLIPLQSPGNVSHANARKVTMELHVSQSGHVKAMPTVPSHLIGTKLWILVLGHSCQYTVILNQTVLGLWRHWTKVKTQLSVFR